MMCWLDPKLILLALALVLSAVEVKGNECTDGSVVYTPAGVTYSCAKCQKGQRVVEDCKEGDLQSTKCEDCPSDQFQNCLSGSRLCYDCKTSCEQNQVVAKQCTKTENLQCKCKVDHAARMQGVELLCQPCKRPKVVIQTAGHEECSLCPDDHYYFKNESLPDVPAKCLPCTDCAQVESPCLADQDAKCKEIPGGTNDDTGWKIGLGVGLGIPALIALVIVIVCILKRRRGSGPRPQGRSSDENGLTAPLADVQDCSDVPEINMDDVLITKTFTWLSRNLGEEWKMFMRHLPGDEFQKQVEVIMDQSRLNERTTSEHIMATLGRWKNECYEDVTTKNVVEALYAAKAHRHSASESDDQTARRYVTDYKRALQEWTNTSNRGASSQANGPNPPNRDETGSGGTAGNPGPEARAPRGGADPPDRSPPGPAPPDTSSHGPPSSGPSPPVPRSSNGPARPSAGPNRSMFGSGEDVLDGRRNPIAPNSVNPPQLELGPSPPMAMAESYSDPSPLEEATNLLDSRV